MMAWVLETFIATTLLMLLVLVVRAPVRKAFGPGMAYALWLLPVLRLVMPPLPGDWQLTRVLAPVTQEAIDGPGVTMGVLNADTMPAELAQHAVTQGTVEIAGQAAHFAVVPPTTVEGGPSIALLLIGLWAIGALAFLAYHLIAHSRFCRKLLSRARIDRTVAQGKVRVIETDAAHGPLAFGIWHKYVAFPRDFAERYDEQERALALAHELGHHVRGDLIANWVALLVLALHWFNPVAWKAFRAFRADQEMACDALVLAGRHQALRHAYGRAIVKSAHGGAVSAACHLHTINEVKGRLRMLSKTNKISPLRLIAGTLGLGGLSAAALALTASGTQAAERITSKVEAATGITLTGQDAPPPPKAPDAPKPPAAKDAPPAPGAPRVERRVYTYTVTEDGKEGEKGTDGKKRVVMIRHDGERTEVPTEAEIMAMIPDVQSGNCKEGEGGEAMVVHPKPGPDGKQKITVCVNRIRVASGEARVRAGEARVMAFQARETGLRSALIGLRHARTTIERDTNLTADQKRDALKGIDSAISEIEQQAKEKHKD
ncbi:M56 family metallopeptidase [Sphingomonas sp. AOB5]|uniref:M56 family metallopeptidase n=1 Tax=Sphingomonas sp. AOB5 TaxID=3034017 RepID=UPI0023F819B1|nr:M56 family metallopeptidase [Sphingomonas sp. AOB5]MDF7775210.1 M56 family metallopeptidase [Sphingomonas sp. AOB5]